MWGRTRRGRCRAGTCGTAWCELSCAPAHRAAPRWGDGVPADVKGAGDLWSLLKVLGGGGVVSPVADGYYVSTTELEKGIAAVREMLGGQTGLGPSAFRDALPVTRKHLIPLLNHLDGLGITMRSDEGRSVLL